MKEKRKYSYLLTLLLIAFVLVNYTFIDSYLNKNFVEKEKETVFVSRVIDGDTIVVGNESIRLLGINTPERSEFFYDEARIFLTKLVVNQSVVLEKGREDRDKYQRLLRYVFLNDKNVNLELIKQGYANYYFPTGFDQYSYKLINAWKNCVNRNVNLCEKSDDVCANCVKLSKFDYKNQRVFLRNECNFGCELTNWQLKEEGRKKFIFPEFVLEQNSEVLIETGKGVDAKNKLFWKDGENVWTKTGDTLFLRDSNDKLVLWKKY